MNAMTTGKAVASNQFLMEKKLNQHYNLGNNYKR